MIFTLLFPNLPDRRVHLLHSKRICFWKFTDLPLRGSLKRFDGSRLIHVNHSVKLIRQASVNVVTDALRLGQINHPDCSLKPVLLEHSSKPLLTPQFEEELRNTDFVEHTFITLVERAGRTRFRSAGPSQLEAAVTVPV
jgi:hypothetical protein